MPITAFPDYTIDTNGIIYNKDNRIIKGTKRGRGKYLSVHFRINGKSVFKTYHRLVAEAFLPNPENKKTVNHIDANKYNNRLDNLEWASNKEQVDHAFKMRLGRIGETHGRSKLKETDILEIRKLNLSQRTIAKLYNVTQSTIWYIKNKKSWRHI